MREWDEDWGLGPGINESNFWRTHGELEDTVSEFDLKLTVLNLQGFGRCLVFGFK